MGTWVMPMVVMDSPLSPPPLPHPQLPMPERSVMLKLNLRLMLMPLLKLIMVITVTPDTTVDTEDTVTDGASREIQCKTLILKERKNNCHQTKLNQKNCCHLILCSRSMKSKIYSFDCFFVSFKPCG